MPDLLGAMDTHGLTFGPTVRGWEAEALELVYDAWISQQGIQPDHAYVLPLRCVHAALLREHWTGAAAWRFLADVINDPHSGVALVARPLIKRRRRT